MKGALNPDTSLDQSQQAGFPNGKKLNVAATTREPYQEAL
jgi:hypothetical protein